MSYKYKYHYLFYFRSLTSTFKLKGQQQNSRTIPGRYIVEFNNEQGAHIFSQSLKDTFEHDYTLGEKYDHELFTGLSFHLNYPNPNAVTASSYDQKLQQLLDSDHVESITPVRIIQRPKLFYSSTHAKIDTADSEADVKAILPHALTQVDRVHKELKNTGKGIVVGIIDSGVDYYHPALGGGFGKGYKVRYGEDLVGDKYDSDSPNPIIKPGPTPLDNCGAASGAEGHGTHVSGIVAGKKGNFIGVVPDAELGMWRVFGCTGSTSNEIIISALLKAYDAGSDIISLSLGDNESWSEGSDAVVASNIVKKGVPVVVAAGNAGASGAFTIGSPSTGNGVYSVASYDNSHQVAYEVIASGSLKATITYGSDSPNKFPSGDITIGDSKIGSGQDACSPDTIPDTVKGKYALVQRGACALVSKAENVAKKGAIGVVIYNNPGDSAFTAVTDNGKIPALGIGAKDGLALIEAIKKGTVTLTFNGKSLIVPILSGKTVSSFSSVGASYELDLRPNIGGVGGLIYSTLPRYLGSYGIMSGTSMATPYVSGTIALYLKSLEHKKKPSPQYILEHFQQYAYKAPVNNGEKTIDTPLRQGAGLIQVYDTIKQQVHITPGQISFNDTSSTKYKTHTLTIINNGKNTVSYQIFNNVSLAVQPYDLKKTGYSYIEPIGYTKDAATLRISKKNIKVAPGKSVKVKITVIPPKTNPKEHIMYGGYVQFKSSNKKSSLDITVPYFGVVGHQKDLPIFDKENGFPYFSTKDDGSTTISKNQTAVISHKKKDVIYLLTRFVSPTAIFERELINLKTGKVIGQALQVNTYLPRNTLDAGDIFIPEAWDGTYYPTTKSVKPVGVPNGTYQIRVKALKLFGNPKKKSDYETWLSPKIQIKA
ncbi:unnamed protein product [Cunninghamella blakesleeana]